MDFLLQKPFEAGTAIIGLFILYSSAKNPAFLLSSHKGDFLIAIFGKTGARAVMFLAGAAALALGILGLMGAVDIRKLLFHRH